MSGSFLECRSNNTVSKENIMDTPFLEILKAITSYGCQANILSWKECRETDNNFDIAIELSNDSISDLTCIDIFSSASIREEKYFRLEWAGIELIGYNDLSGKNAWENELINIVEEKITVYDTPSKMTSGKFDFCRIYDPVIEKSVCCQSERSYRANQAICKRMVYSRRKIAELGFRLF